MTRLLLVSTLVAISLCFAAGQGPCVTPSGRNGTCVPIDSCESLKKRLSNNTPESVMFIRNSVCSNKEEPIRVCCRSPENSLERCVTPDGIHGSCVGLRSCPQLTNMQSGRTRSQNIRYIIRSRCGEPARGKYCCATPTISTSSTAHNNNICQLTASPPDPSSDCCGVQVSGPKIVGGSVTVLDEYPWLAILEYRIHYQTKLMCGGALVSGQYVLTAAHCIGKSARRPVNVRLGEYDTDNDGRDCRMAPGGGPDCNDGAVSVPIKDIIKHPDYAPTMLNHDIALIKLARIIQFTDFIRPICLPTSDFTAAASLDVDLCVVGWGATETEVSSNVKLKVSVPYVTLQECQPQYTFPVKIELGDGHICAGGERGKDSCRGDSGGPLMTRTKGRHELVGIVNFGRRQCGTENVPGVYTKVFHYLSWIQSKMVA